MSRALVTFSRKDRESGTPRLESVMAQMGCSEPVARNMLKSASLGIGPLAQAGGAVQASEPSQARLPGPPKPAMNMKQAMAMAEKKKREEDEQDMLDTQKSKEKTMSFGGFGVKKPLGIARLGPVLARPDEVDPFKSAVNPAPPPDELAPVPPEVRAKQALEAKQAAEKRRAQAEEEKRAALRKKRRKKRGKQDEASEESNASSDEAEAHDDSRFVAPKLTLMATPSAVPQVDKSSEARRVKEERATDLARRFREEKPHERNEKQDSPPRTRTAGGGLMTEAEIMAQMGKEKKTQRGSLRAQTRIQKEMQEWEDAKRQNVEYWKPPQHCLVFQAESSKARSQR